MKILILLLIIYIANIQSLIVYESECSIRPTCALCATEWDCKYGQSQEKIDECYKHCLASAADYDEHGNVLEADEVKPHFIQLKKKNQKKNGQQSLIQEAKGPEQIDCEKNPMCNECAISYMCNYGQKDAYDIEMCYKNCNQNKNAYGYEHDKALKQKEVEVH